MADIAALLAGLDAGERVRGRGFERLCKWVLENEPEYAAKLERVWLWDEWPGRWAADAGIDLVGQERDGGLWAVQAKHYDAAYAIKKADLDSFLSESSRPEFTYRLLIASTDHLGATARRTLDAQEKPVGTLLRSDLGALDLPWPRSLARLSPAKLKRKRPRPHQRSAVKDVVVGLAEHDRGQLVMACGTGKTLAARFLHDELGSKRTLVLVPSLSLVKQTIREWFTVGDFDYLAVCSDDTVATQDRDAVVASTSELGVPVTTDPTEIAAFLRKRGSRPRVVFATYQSSQRIADAQTGRTPMFDLVVADEAHRCAGPEAGVFATVLDPTKIKARKRLFMTATPRYYTGRIRKEASEADWEIASMDDEQKFGPELHRLTFAQAIDKDLLCDYQVVVVGVSDSSYREMAQRAAFVTADGETITDARTLASQLGLLRAMRNHDLHRAVSFHSRIRSAREFATSLPEVSRWMPARRRPSGRLWTQHVSGEMSSGEREAHLNQLREIVSGECGVLTNARCLTEGVDVPTLDGVAFIEPRRSQVDIVQAVGRAMRKADDKTIGTIVIPIFVEESADPEHALDSSEFDRVWSVVKALRAHDEVLAEELDELRRRLGPRGSVGKRPSKIVLDLPVQIGNSFALAFDSRLVEITTRRWEFWFGLLEDFAYREGHARPTVSHVERGFGLGRWTVKQRAGRRSGTLDALDAERLQNLPGWVWDVYETDWRLMYQVLTRFSQREGHANPLQQHVEEGLPLGVWCAVQRAFHRRGKLHASRRQRLEELPGWSWEPRTTRFERNFDALSQYISVYRRPPPPKAVFEGIPVGRFADKQRQRHRRGVLSADRTARFDALAGWEWSPWEQSFDEAFELCADFSAQTGQRIVRSTVFRGRKVGVWAESQRALHRRGLLSAERERRLSSLPTWSWEPDDSTWQRQYEALGRFTEREGHSRVPQSHVEADIALGRWVLKQRQAYRRGELRSDRVARLEALRGWTWDTRKKT